MKYYLPFILITLFAFGCGNNSQPQQPVQHTDYKLIKKELLKRNQDFADIEDQQITKYVKRHGWNMTKLGNGVRYMIYKHGNGAKAKAGMTAKIDFKVSLLSGELLYSSKVKGPASFVIGRDQDISYGLQYGIQYLHVGDKAIFIVPSNLAFGVHGDNNKIPSRATVVYDITLLKLS